MAGGARSLATRAAGSYDARMAAPAQKQAVPAPDPAPTGVAVRAALLLAVFLGSLAPFLPALSQGFVELDDDRNFLLNEAYRGLGGEPGG